MATSWRDGIVKCPFYLRDNAKDKRLVCQGVMEGVELAWNFENQQDYGIHMQTFCWKKYQNCEVYRMLEQIYEED